MEPSSTWNILSALGEWFANCNLVLVVIGLCSFIGIAVFIERLLYLAKIDIDTDALIIELKSAIEGGNIAEAMRLCEARPGAVSNIVRAGIAQHERGREYIEDSMELRGMIEVAKMEKNARILSIIAHISPLIGLLGTVLGFIRAFGEMRMSSLVEISSQQIGGAMEYALVTTAAGLVVAIPAVLAYNYIVSRIEGITVEIQATAAEVVDVLTYPSSNFGRQS
jgi:biopolymer transport protein ExbB